MLEQHDEHTEGLLLQSHLSATLIQLARVQIDLEQASANAALDTSAPIHAPLPRGVTILADELSSENSISLEQSEVWQVMQVSGRVY
jgi:hypothetical protein